MDFQYDLRKWAQLRSLRPTVLTVYLDSRKGPDRKFLSREGRRIEALFHDDRELRENFLKALREVRAHLEKEAPDSPGVALIADPSQGVFERYDLPRPVDNAMVLDTSPYIRPLAQLKEDWEPFGLVMLDHGSAHLYLVYLSRVTDTRSLETEVLAHQKNGGWSQARYSRRRKNRIADFLREVAAELAALLRRERVNRVILAGAAEAKHELVEHLPQELQRKVVGFLDVTMDTGESALLRDAFPLFFAAEVKEERAMILEVRDRIASGGLAVAGVDDTAMAVVAGRAERIVLKADFKPRGWKCERCDVMEGGEAEACVLCGERVYPVDLVEEIVEYAQRTSAEVIFVRNPEPVLDELGGIGALLRY